MSKLSLLTALCSSLCLAQGTTPAPDWSNFQPLLGRWVADPGPDGTTGAFTMAIDLGGRAVVRRSHTDSPKTKEHPASHHEDMLVTFNDSGELHASYWDNEGHRIEYDVTVKGNAYTYLSKPEPGSPQYRLTYLVGEKGALSITFEIAPPDSNGAFKPYLKATAHRK